MLLTILVAAVVWITDLSWNTLDFKVIDRVYRYVVEEGEGPEINNRVLYLNITDSTYIALNSNSIDRTYLAEINDILADLSPDGVMYDLIFSRPSNPEADSIFSASIENAGMIYLPGGFQLSKEKQTFHRQPGAFYDILLSRYLFTPRELNKRNAYYAGLSVPQYDPFAEAAAGTGHISVISDPDGIYRHYPLVISVDSLLFPTVAFAMYLDYQNVPLDSIIIEWGNEIIIPPVERSYVKEAIHIPIDEHGNIFVPYPARWHDSPKMVQVESLIEFYSHDEYYDELLEKFEGSFVFFGDVSSGISDLGHTTIQNDVPLVAIHGAIFNGLLTESFYSRLDTGYIILIILLTGIVLGIFGFPKSNVPLFIIGLLLFLLFSVFVYQAMLQHLLIPAFTIGGAITLIFLGILISLQVISSQQQAFIKNAFSKYVPHSVVEELLDKPDTLKLGGEERTLTILFSDVASFTTMSEQMNPTELVHLLNEYLTNMTGIIIEQKGIVDKFLGDGILAEYGIPLPLEKHADAAIRTGLLMHRKLDELNREWKKKNYPDISCRVGINSGQVIAGNMGSFQVFDYTVIGDAVNLGARLESANKQYNTNMLISESTYNLMTPGLFRVRLLDFIKVKGKSKAVKVYNVYGFADDEIDKSSIDYYSIYDEALKYYLQQDFEAAQKLFTEALRLRNDDLASKEFLNRIAYLKENPPGDDWDGSTALLKK